MEENKSHQQLDELIRSKFSGAENAPDDFVWENIEAQLDKKRRRPGFIYWLSGILLLVIGGSAILIYVNQNNAVDQAISSIDFSAGKNKEVENIVKSTKDLSNNKIYSTEKALSLHAKTEVQNENSGSQRESTSISSTINKTDSSVKVEASTVNASPASIEKKQERGLTTNSSLKQNVSSKGRIYSAAKSSTPEPTPVAEENLNNMVDLQDKTNKVSTNEGTNNHNVALNVNDSKQIKNAESNERTSEEQKKLEDAKKQEAAKKLADETVAELNAKQKMEEQRIADEKREEEKKAAIRLAQEQLLKDQMAKATADSLAQVAELAAAIVEAEVPKDSTPTKKDSTKVNLAAEIANTPKSDSAKKADDFLRMMLSVYYSPEYYENKIQDNSGQFVSDETQSNRYSAGIKFSYVLLDKLTVRLGVAYSELKQQLDVHKIYFDRYQTEPFVFHSSMGDMPVDMSIMKDGFSPLAPPAITQFWCSYYYYQHAQFIHIPLEVKYGFTFGRVGISAMVGINTQYALKQQAELNLIKEHFTNTVTYSNLNLNTISFAATGGLSFDFKLTKRLSLFLEPNARYNITPISRSTDVKSKAYFLGVNGGVGFHF